LGRQSEPARLPCPALPQAAAERIRQGQADAQVDVLELDLSSLASVRAFASEFIK
jgi:hypothetical protein